MILVDLSFSCKVDKVNHAFKHTVKYDSIYSKTSSHHRRQIAPNKRFYNIENVAKLYC